jgi:hypothetical protein
MTLLKPGESSFMTAEAAAQRRVGFMSGSGSAAAAELSLRNNLEAFSRERWPDARIVHEMVMGEGKVRADVVAIDTAHIAAFEVKGAYDDTSRLLNQVGMYSLCVPEVWIVADEKHCEDARLIRHLLPSVGLILGSGWHEASWRAGPEDINITLRVEAEPTHRVVVPDMSLRMLWAEEIRAAAFRLRTWQGQKGTRKNMVASLLNNSRVQWSDVWVEICRELRGRDALWRADAPVRPVGVAP